MMTASPLTHTGADFYLIPEELQQRPQFVPWAFGSKPHASGKYPKIPRNVRDGREVQQGWPSARQPFEAVLSFISDPANRMDGLGFILTPDDPYTCLDLDDCIDDAGALSPEAAAIVASFPPTYIERSPSGNGLHVWARGTLPTGSKNRTGTFEVYDGTKPQFMAMTGDVWEDAPRSIAEAQDALNAYVRDYIGFKPTAPTPTPPLTPVSVVTASPYLSDQQVMDKLLYSNQLPELAEKIRRLWAGETADYANDHSVADIALCREIAYWTQDPEQVFRVFQQSGLYGNPLRVDKWNRHDYRASTISKAIADRAGRFWRVEGLKTLPRPTQGAAQPTNLIPAAPRVSRAIPRSLWDAQPQANWLLHNLLIAGKVNMLYGRGSTYKSFVAFSMAAAVATGLPCFDRDCRQSGAVLWIATEGAEGLHPMALAWEQTHNGGQPLPDTFAMIPERVNLSDPNGVLETLEDINAVFPEGTKPALIVIDTLSKTMSGEENSNDDAKKYIEHCELLSRETGAALLVIAHSPKSDTGIRGGAAFYDDATLVMHQERKGETVTISFEKSRGVRQPDALTLRAHTVAYGEGEEDSSLVFLPEGTPRILASENGSTAYNALKTFGPSGARFSDWQRASGITQNKSLTRQAERLIQAGLVFKDDTTGRYIAAE